MMFVYYGYAFPLSTRIARGFYGDGVWSDSGFMRWGQISAVSWKEEGRVTLILISHFRNIARRLEVPAHLYGQARRVLRDKVKAHDIHIAGAGSDLGPGRARRDLRAGITRLNGPRTRPCTPEPPYRIPDPHVQADRLRVWQHAQPGKASSRSAWSTFRSRCSRPPNRPRRSPSTSSTRECQTRIQQKRWCPHCDREVPLSEIVKGYEFEKGRYVVIEEEDIQKVRVESTRVIDLAQFTDDTVDRSDLRRSRLLPGAGRRRWPRMRSP